MIASPKPVSLLLGRNWCWKSLNSPAITTRSGVIDALRVKASAYARALVLTCVRGTGNWKQLLFLIYQCYSINALEKWLAKFALIRYRINFRNYSITSFTWVIAVCSVQTELEITKWLYLTHLHSVHNGLLSNGMYSVAKVPWSDSSSFVFWHPRAVNGTAECLQPMQACFSVSMHNWDSHITGTATFCNWDSHITGTATYCNWDSHIL